MAQVNRSGRLTWIHLLFFCSGFPALIYQIVWQRALFAIYGLNIESVTIVVSGFMLGLGIGGLLGGKLSSIRRFAPVKAFAIAELVTGAFGLVSLRAFHRMADFTAGMPHLETRLIGFFTIVLSTLLMGATLPLLVEYSVRSSRNVGSSVAGLYYANCLGSGLACFLAAWWLMRYLGQTGSVRFAATVNILVAGGALIHEAQRRESNSDFPQPVLNDSSAPDTKLPHFLALGCVAFSGFAALSYEIIWYRVLAFGLSDTATAFASLLGSYLFGLALGSRFVERYSRNHDRISAMRRLSGVIFASAVLAFAVGPLSALAFSFTSPNPENRGPGLIILLLVCSGASFFGAIFPLVAHVSVNPQGPVGASLSYLYGANIVGSTLGTLVVGYVLLDYWSVYKISIALLIGGSIFSLSVLLVAARPFNLQPRIALAAAAMFLMIVVARPIFSTLYDRLLFKNHYPRLHFQEVVETRSGTIAVTPEGTLFGGGVYDGRFNIDLFHDVNIIVRPFALSALHPAPRQVLMIGLGSGSWAQVLANHPQVESLTVVEINPGYLKLISEYPAVRTLLQNPKVHVVIDDGRRWLLSNRSVKFDAIVMNTTFYWRNHASNLLSIEFLQTARSHLQPGGVLFYNTTGSEDAIATGLAVYPYAFRLVNALAVSDSPLVFDRGRWKTILLSYVIDGKPVIDVNDPKQLEKVDKITSIPEDPTGRTLISVESNDQLRSRLRKRLIITDDNMGLEWR